MSQPGRPYAAGMAMPEIVLRGMAMRRDRGLVMAILNRTPDSFCGKGATFDDGPAQDAVARFVDEGADIIDVGGVKAGAQGPDVDVAEEIRRVVPFVAWVREHFPQVAISVDTWRHEVGREVCEAGAHLINDTWAAYDPQLMGVAGEAGAGYVCSHTGGLKPRTDPFRPAYAKGVTQDVLDTVTELAERAVAAGVPREGIIIDPTFDFGKNTWHSLELMRNLPILVETGWPVLIAVSNKDFLAETIGCDREDWEALQHATAATHTNAAFNGGAVFRTHNVPATVQVLEIASF